MLATLILGAAVVLLTWLIRHLRKERGELEKLGIPVDPPVNLLLGSGPHDLHNHYGHLVITTSNNGNGTTTTVANHCV